VLSLWRPGIADRLLRGNDVSYGVDIHHTPIVNLPSYRPFISPPASFAIALAGTTGFTALFWRFVEYPLLRRSAVIPPAVN
jgi:peptidoglycan/LPS O-acetylase OafA/YrhL